MSGRTDDVAATIEALFPYDGPHTPDRVRAAAEAVSALVRYLNNATRRGDSIRQPSDLAQIVGYLSGATAGLPQTLSQLAQHARRIARWADVYDDRGSDPGVVATDCGMHLQVAATNTAAAAQLLAAAHDAASRLGTSGGEAR